MRYAIKGERPGTTVHAAGRFVATDPIDGGAAFTEAQLADLKRRGHELVALKGPTSNATPKVDVKAQSRIAGNAAAAKQHNENVNRAPSKASAVNQK